MRNKRRIFWIDNSFQLDFVKRVFGVMFLTSLIVLGLVIYFNGGVTIIPVDNTRRAIGVTSEVLWPIIMLTVSITGIFSAVTVLYLSVRVSHRIAGPAYRMKKDIEEMMKGDWERSFQLRKSDSLKDLASSLRLLGQDIHRRRCEMNRDLLAFRQAHSGNQPVPESAWDELLRKMDANWGK